MQTRKYPRTMLEAFPKTADYASAVTISRKERVADVALAVVIGLALAVCLFYGLSQ